ncbi:hypothetical protein D3C73_1463390 [compost metagenome]
MPSAMPWKWAPARNKGRSTDRLTNSAAPMLCNTAAAKSAAISVLARRCWLAAAATKPLVCAST